MGTRGALVYVTGDRELIQYNHFDSYPSALGFKVGEFIQSMLGGELEQLAGLSEGYIEKVRELIQALEVVNQSDTPTPEQAAKHREFAQAVSTGDDWYAILRDCQGDPEATLRAGIIATAEPSWLADSLFCEWAYVMDFNEKKVEVYEGFNRGRPEGRYRHLHADGGSEYTPVSLVASFSFHEVNLPDKIAAVESEEEEVP